MSIYDRTEDASTDTLLKGMGFSVMKERAGLRARFDIWDGDIARSVPVMAKAAGDVVRDYGELALTKLGRDAQSLPVLQPAYDRMRQAMAQALA